MFIETFFSRDALSVLSSSHLFHRTSVDLFEDWIPQYQVPIKANPTCALVKEIQQLCLLTMNPVLVMQDCSGRGFSCWYTNTILPYSQCVKAATDQLIKKSF